MKLFSLFAFSTAVFMTTAFCVQAQDNAYFQVDDSIICVNQTVTVTVNLASDAASYEYGDGQVVASTFSNPPPHTYTTVSPAAGFKFKQFVNTLSVYTDPDTGKPEAYKVYTVHIKVVDDSPLSVTPHYCANGDVYLYINDTRFDSYTVDFKDGAPITVTRDPSGLTKAFHHYGSAGPFPNVSVHGVFLNNNTCPVTDYTTTITPVTTVPTPDITYLETSLEDLAVGTLTLHMKSLPGYDYYLDFERSGSLYHRDTVKIGSTDTTLVYDKNTANPYDPITHAALHNSFTLNTQQNSYCVRPTLITACGSIASPEICSITRFNLTAADLETDMTWETYSGPNITSIDVKRADVGLLANVAGTATAYNDNNNIHCAQNYCYRLTGHLSTTSNSGTNQYVLGPLKCIDGASLTPRPALTNVNSTINGSSITVTFDAVTGGFTAKDYTLLESVNGGSYSPVASNAGTATTFTLTDRNTTGNSYCYQVTYVDLCNVSPTAASAVTTCPIKLTVGLAEDGTVAINWTSYAGSTAVTGYIVNVEDENGNIFRSIPAGSSNSATDLLSSTGSQLFYIVTSSTGNTQSALEELILSPAIFVPNTFSPNGDGINDRFDIKSRFVKSMEVSVFNRWGEPVFHSTDMTEQWDGKVNGGDATVGTYAYTVEATGQKGETIKQKGTISIAR